jgi:hypothetical protein
MFPLNNELPELTDLLGALKIATAEQSVEPLSNCRLSTVVLA